MKYLLPLIFLFFAGCSDSTTRSRDAGRDRTITLDGGTDAPRPDLAITDLSKVEGGVTPDLTPDQQQGQEAGGDLYIADATGWDLSLSKSTALYTATVSTGSFTLRQVSGAGGAKPTAVTGWTGTLDLESLQLAAMDPYLQVNRTTPYRAAEALTGFEGIHLPGALGTVYYYHRKLSGMSGLMVVRPKGPPVVLLEVSGLYSDTLSSTLGFSSDGTLGAVVEGKTKVHIFRTDGTTFTGGKAVVEVTPPSTVGTFTSFSSSSLTFAGGHLYCVGKDKTKGDMLLRAPADGSATLSPITLPKSAGATPTAVNPQVVVSADGKSMALTAGSMSTVTDLYLLDLASGKAHNVTASPSYIAYRGSYFGNVGGQMALSPKGGQVAYVKWVNGTPELYVSSTTAGAKPALLSANNQFRATVAAFYNLIFPDEKNLLFMAGQVYYYMDLYRYDVATKKLANLSGSGSTARPFDGQGDFSPQGAWLSPNGKWFYWVGYDYYASPSPTADIMAVDLNTYKHSKITSGARVSTSADGHVACPKDGNVYWAVEAKPGTYSQELYVFNQNTGKKGVRVTNMTRGTSAYWFNHGLTLTKGCGELAWAGGGGYSNRHMFVMNPKLPSTERQLTKTPRYIAPRLTFSPDGLSLLYGGGGSSTAATLKTVTIAGGGATQLDSKAGYLHIFSVY